MTSSPQDFPESCQAALAAIEADPLDLPQSALGHLRVCPACAEARVQWHYNLSPLSLWSRQRQTRTILRQPPTPM